MMTEVHHLHYPTLRLSHYELTAGKEASYLHHDGGVEGAPVVHPAIHTGLRGRLARVGQGPIRVKELPLGAEEAATLLWPQVRVQWDGDSEEGVLPKGPSAVSRDRVVVEDVDPAAVTGDHRGEVLQ